MEHITKTLPGFIAAAQPPSPNSTLSVCAALTTTLTMTSQCCASSAGVAQATPPSAAKASATPGRASTTWTCVAGAAQRPRHAAAHRAQPDDADLLFHACASSSSN